MQLLEAIQTSSGYSIEINFLLFVIIILLLAK